MTRRDPAVGVMVSLAYAFWAFRCRRASWEVPGSGRCGIPRVWVLRAGWWSLRRDGEDWLLHAGPERARLRDSRGLMLLNQSGRIRTGAEFRELFTAAGLQLTRIIPTASPNSILEGVRA